ncbi:MAG: DUF1592 domain-containing protein [Pirellulales bacterium]|nr:DUF1592 domain-containing protein [Pirellulales bacterium]
MAWLVAIGLICLAAHRSGAEETAPAEELSPDAFFEQRVTPFLETYCQACHTGDVPKGGVSFDGYTSRQSLREHLPVWKKVTEQLDFESMPPADELQPEKAERREIVEWLKTVGTAPDSGGPVDPGRVTIRRLNRAEYNNTIRDLVGVEIDAAADFPADDVGYGFDNIGDVLSMPPVLLEKFLDAAEKVTNAAIRTVDQNLSTVRRFDAGDKRVEGGMAADTTRNLYSQGEIFVEPDFPVAGEYILRASAFGDQAGGEPVKMGFHLGRDHLDVVDVPAEVETPGVYEVRAQAQAGRHRFAVSFDNDYYRTKGPEEERGDRNLYVSFLEVEGPIALEPTPLPESHRRIIYRTPAEGEADDACARELLVKFASRAFRRPATDDEVTRLVELFKLRRGEGGSFEQSIQLAVTAVLVSPSFLFRIEEDRLPSEPGGISAPISDYELASRLSYFLWSSLPDEELLAVAAAGTLHEPATCEAQIRRMLTDPKSDALVRNFADQWLQIRSLDRLAPDPKLFPEFDELLRAAMAEESRQFFAGVMREDRSVLELLDANYTYVNERLARHYGLEGVTGEEFRRVELPAGARGGVLTQASVLTVTSNPTRTSPVKRGKWVLETLLGTPPPPPPADVPLLAEGEQAALTGSLRERMVQHRENPNCASCHERMDPLGFGLENFDAVGRWREKDGEFPIDPSGTLPSGENFAGPAELRQILLGSSGEFRRSLAEKLLTYALGRGLEYYDRTAVDSIVHALENNGDRFTPLVTAVVASDPFRLRRATQVAATDSPPVEPAENSAGETP